MSHLTDMFFKEKGYSWNCNSSAYADYIEWLEAKVEKLTEHNGAMDAICPWYNSGSLQQLQAKIRAVADKLFVCHFQSGSGGLDNLALINELRELSAVQ